MSKSAAEFKRLVRGLFARTSGSASSCCLFAFALPPQNTGGHVLHKHTTQHNGRKTSSCSRGLGQFRTEFTAGNEYSILHNTMTEELSVSCSLGFGQFRTEFTAGSEYSILHNTMAERLAVVAEVSDSLGQSLQADDVELNVLGCQVDILGTNLSLIHI